jgi:hypothetical protein
VVSIREMAILSYYLSTGRMERLLEFPRWKEARFIQLNERGGVGRKISKFL